MAIILLIFPNLTQRTDLALSPNVIILLRIKQKVGKNLLIRISCKL